MNALPYKTSIEAFINANLRICNSLIKSLVFEFKLLNSKKIQITTKFDHKINTKVASKCIYFNSSGSFARMDLTISVPKRPIFQKSLICMGKILRIQFQNGFFVVSILQEIIDYFIKCNIHFRCLCNNCIVQCIITLLKI